MPEQEVIKMINEFIDFLFETFEYIKAETRNLATRANDEVIQPVLDVSSIIAQGWWDRAIKYSKWTLLALAMLSIAAFSVNWIWHIGWPTSIAGVIIAIVMFPLLVWWTPLISVIGAVRSILKLNFKSAPGELDNYAVSWMKIILLILTWMLICTFLFSVIPFWNRPSSLPILILTGILLMLTGILWAAKPWYQKVIRGAVMAFFVFHIFACFYTPFVKALQGYINSHMQTYEKSLKRVVNKNKVKSIQATYTTFELLEGYKGLNEGQKVAVVEEIKVSEIGSEKMVEVVPEESGEFTGGSVLVPANKLKIPGKTDSAPDAQAKILPRDTQMMAWIVTTSPEELIKAYNGDTFEYKSPYGFWIIEEDGDKHYHNPSSKPGEVREFSFYDMNPGGEIVKIVGENKFQLSFQITTT
jgi:hypothetical protein